MPTVMKISPQGQIRLPEKMMNAIGITKGDYVEVDVEGRQIVLKPRKLIDPSQGWYWTKEWQEMEARVDDDIKAGHVSPKFKTAEDGLKWLKK